MSYNQPDTFEEHNPELAAEVAAHAVTRQQLADAKSGWSRAFNLGVEWQERAKAAEQQLADATARAEALTYVAEASVRHVDNMRDPHISPDTFKASREAWMAAVDALGPKAAASIPAAVEIEHSRYMSVPRKPPESDVPDLPGGGMLWGARSDIGFAKTAPSGDVRLSRPRIVCLCGSTRFMEAWQKANLDETLAGRIVLSIGCNTKSDADLQRMGELTDEKKCELDELHKRKIDLCDEVYVLNVGGYIGSSTRSEIEYAERLGRPIRYLEDAALANEGGD